MSVEQRILDLPAFADYNDRRQLRAIALEVRKREDRIKQLEDRIHRASMAFFEEVPDDSVVSGMLQILEEERRKK